MIQGRITAKSQTTVPLPVRRALGLGPGDAIVWAVEDGRAVMTRAPVVIDPFANPLATFTEWADPIDTKDFAGF